MTIYFAGTERDAVSGGYGISTNSSYYDSIYSKLAVSIPNGLSCGAVLPNEIGAGTSYWVGWSIYIVVGSAFAAGLTQLLRAYNTAGALSVHIDVAGTEGFYLYAYNTSGTSGRGNVLKRTDNLLHRFDLNVYTSGGKAYADLYRNNVLVNQAQVSGTSRGLKTLDLYPGCASGAYVSEIIVADESTLGMRVKTYRPTADGTHTTWAGNYDNVNNDDVGIDAISTQLANAAETFLHGATLNEGTAIRALVVGAAAASEEPTGAHAVILSGGTLHSQAFVKPLSQGAPPNVAIFETNPDTDQAWTASEFNSLEFGVQHA